MFTTVKSPVSQSAPTPPVKANDKPRTKDLGPVFAILEIDCPGDYRPKNVDSSPCEDLAGIPADLACDFAIKFNASDHAKKKRRWACVGLNGAMFYLCDIQQADRPENPAAFPKGSVTGLTYDEALQIQETANAERMRLARVPRRWTVALRPLGDAQTESHRMPVSIDAAAFWQAYESNRNSNPE